MNSPSKLICQSDPRREQVRRQAGRNGLDYVEVGGAGEAAERTLCVYFLGKLPPELATNQPGIERFLRLDGGERSTGISILDADPQPQADPERDDVLVLHLDARGDFSVYTLHLVGVAGIDPHYASASFSFRIDCTSGLDCASGGEGCDGSGNGRADQTPATDPPINYLAKDYDSFRQLMFDRLALLMPGWTERHAGDLGVMLVELLAYVGDQLSYYQDAVATEAYIGTARQRISVRRHALLVDYRLHEGCNARAWLHLNVSGRLELNAARVGFITGLNLPLSQREHLLTAQDLAALPARSHEYFEPFGTGPVLQFRPAHNTIRIYAWGRRDCCLRRGATSATLLDAWVAGQGSSAGFSAGSEAAAHQTHPKRMQERKRDRSACPPDPDRNSDPNPDPSPPGRALHLQPGDVLIFEERLGPKTGAEADADPARRCAVRLTRVTLTDDPLYLVDHPFDERGAVNSPARPAPTARLPTPLVEVEWARADALPFDLCLSTLGPAPACAGLVDVSVARGNIVLVDHGRTLAAEPLGPVPGVTEPACCVCEGQPGDVATRAGRFRPTLAQAPLVFHAPWSAQSALAPASQSLRQAPRDALPALRLTDAAGQPWRAQSSLLDSGADARDFVAEIDNTGHAHLRFGDAELGRSPAVGDVFSAVYRVGGGTSGNVGAESITRLVLHDLTLGGVSVSVRNPLAAQGGVGAEPLDDARLLAPAAMRQRIERAITAADYAEIAARNPRLQRAAARLAWTGSWYEAEVAVDPLNDTDTDTDADAATSASDRRDHDHDALRAAISADLHRYRRIGHDLRVRRAVHVPLALTLDICVQPDHERGRVKAALLERFGRRGFFHPDQNSFGQAVHMSRIVAAAQGVPGVASVTVSRFQRRFAAPNHEIASGVLALAANEIAQLDNDPNHPERGELQIVVRGGR